MPEAEQVTIDMGASMETEEALNIIDALNGVADVLSMSGPHVTFTGTKVAALANVGELAGVDVYSCPRGWFILFRSGSGPHWCTAGTSASEAVAAIEDDGLREIVRQQLQAQQLL
jgi:hypothetical protein